MTHDYLISVIRTAVPAASKPKGEPVAVLVVAGHPPNPHNRRSA